VERGDEEVEGYYTSAASIAKIAKIVGTRTEEAFANYQAEQASPRSPSLSAQAPNKHLPRSSRSPVRSSRITVLKLYPDI